MMSTEELDELERLCGAATPGPWEVDPRNNDILNESLGSVTYGREYSPEDGSYGDFVTTAADAEFICAARQAVPRLIARVRELEAKLRVDPKNQSAEQFDRVMSFIEKSHEDFNKRWPK